jgi:hypothetical protein
MTTLKEKAIFYWQDSIAKFFPTAKGPSTVEIDMYEAGYEQARLEIIEERKAAKERRKKWREEAAAELAASDLCQQTERETK